MNLSPTLTLEAGVAIALTLVLLWVKPAVGLFLYGLALGFPDLAVPVGSAINIRIDDCLIIAFLVRTVLWAPAPLANGQSRILKWQSIFLSLCVLSAAIGFASGAPSAAYETLKMIGCAAIIGVLPRLVQSERRLQFLVAGLMCGGIALVIQMIRHLVGHAASLSANFQEFKNAASFATWNPNTIGQASILLVFAAGLGWIISPNTRWNAALWFTLATGFALAPILVFARGTSLSIATGYLLFLLLARRWKLALLVIGLCSIAALFLHTANADLIDSAANVDIATGEGLSHRFDRWAMAIDAIESAPLLGHGFGQEWPLLESSGSEGRAHNAYMTVWIEIGLAGVVLLLIAISQFAVAGLSLYRAGPLRLGGGLILALLVALCLDSLGLSTLYWEKLPTIALAIAIALVGICERRSPGIVLEPLDHTEARVSGD